jgi:hypothetical protein
MGIAEASGLDDLLVLVAAVCGPEREDAGGCGELSLTEAPPSSAKMKSSMFMASTPSAWLSDVFRSCWAMPLGAFCG